jgi:nicotinamidase-related amidase
MKKILIIMAVLITLSSCSEMLSIEKFKSSETAFLIIDVQNAYLPVYNQVSFIQNIDLLLKQAREAKVPIIYIRNIDWINNEGSRGWTFQGSMRAQVGDYVIEKHYPSSFSDTDLNSKAIIPQGGISCQK